MSNYYLDDLPRAVDDGSQTVTYAYDGAGNTAARSVKTDVGGTTVNTTYQYNTAELLAAATSDVAGGASTDFYYDAGGRQTQTSLPNGDTSVASYNPDNTVASVSLTDAANDTLAGWTYGYDALQRITSQGFTGTAASPGAAVTGTAQYGYDTASRLTSYTPPGGTAEQVSYDLDSNRTCVGPSCASPPSPDTVDTSFAYNQDDSIATETDPPGTGHSYAYSPAGNLSSDGTDAYCYDRFNRLNAVSTATDTSCATPQISYKYDGLDRQTGQTATAPVGPEPADATVTQHYDGFTGTLLTQTSSDAPAVAPTSYETTPSGQPVAVSGPTNSLPTQASIQYLSTDGQGDVTTATAAAGNVACTARFDPWGNADQALANAAACSSGDTPDTLFYRAANRDPVTGNYQLGARTYAPAKNSFLTPDNYRTGGPAADLSVGTDPLTRNTYTYVNGDPVNLVDPTGHMVEGCSSSGQCYHASPTWNEPVPTDLSHWTAPPSRPWNNGPVYQPNCNGMLLRIGICPMENKDITLGLAQTHMGPWQFAFTLVSFYLPPLDAAEPLVLGGDMASAGGDLASAAGAAGDAAATGARIVGDTGGLATAGDSAASAVQDARLAAQNAGRESLDSSRAIASGDHAAAEAGSGAATTAARNFQFGELGGPLGETDLSTGEITIQRGLTGQVFDETLRHEIVHSVLTPSNPLLNGARAWLYENSQLWRFGEEATAETYATGSLTQGLAFPLGEGYGISLGRLGAELFGVGAVAGGTAYGIYQASQ